jgi:hypothetical protein
MCRISCFSVQRTRFINANSIDVGMLITDDIDFLCCSIYLDPNAHISRDLKTLLQYTPKQSTEFVTFRPN